MFMGRREHAAFGTTLLVVLGLGPSACVKDAPLDMQTDRSSAGVETTSGPLLPLAKGNAWTYKVTKEGKTSTKVLTVEAEETVGGEGPASDARAFRVASTKDGKADAVTWEALEGKKFVRYREQELSKSGAVKSETHWDPPRLTVDGTSAHVAKRATWSEEYAETVIEDGDDKTSDEKDSWSVDAVDETVTVPAGTFRALVLRRQGGSKAKTFWYVKGVGKVKEDGDELEELVSYELGKGDDDEPSDEGSDQGSGDQTAAEPSPDADADADAEPIAGAGGTSKTTPDAGTRASTVAVEARGSSVRERRLETAP